MIDLGATIAAMKEAGMDDASIVAALACLRQSEPKTVELTARQLRNKHYYRRLDISVLEWRERRTQVFDRDGYRCVYCGVDVSESPQCDHVTPLYHGGTSDLSNLATACKSCNSSKSGYTMDEWRAAGR